MWPSHANAQLTPRVALGHQDTVESCGHVGVADDADGEVDSALVLRESSRATVSALTAYLSTSFHIEPGCKSCEPPNLVWSVILGGMTRAESGASPNSGGRQQLR